MPKQSTRSCLENNKHILHDGDSRDRNSCRSGEIWMGQLGGRRRGIYTIFCILLLHVSNTAPMLIYCQVYKLE